MKHVRKRTWLFWESWGRLYWRWGWVSGSKMSWMSVYQVGKDRQREELTRERLRFGIWKLTNRPCGWALEAWEGWGMSERESWGRRQCWAEVPGSHRVLWSRRAGSSCALVKPPPASVGSRFGGGIQATHSPAWAVMTSLFAFSSSDGCGSWGRRFQNPRRGRIRSVCWLTGSGQGGGGAGQDDWGVLLVRHVGGSSKTAHAPFVGFWKRSDFKPC